jgi:ribokinase
MKKILVIGSANMDLSLNVFKVPEAGQTLIDDGGIAYTPGGKGANSAMCFKKLGADCALCAKLGVDQHGNMLFNYYKEAGLDTSYLKVDHDNPTGLAVVIKECNGENRIILYPGANSFLSNDNIAAAFACNPDAVYLGFEIPFSSVLTAAKIAAQRGIPIFIDAAPASKDYPLENLPPVEVFSPNETETLEYTGIMPQGSESCLRAAFALRSKVKCKYIVIKLGARGSFIYDGTHFDIIPAFKPRKVVDTTAAGDTFTAALTIKYLENGGRIKEAATYASAAAAISVSRQGASSSTPTVEEIAEFLANAE